MKNYRAVVVDVQDPRLAPTLVRILKGGTAPEIRYGFECRDHFLLLLW